MTWKNFWRTWWMVVRRPGESFRRMRLGARRSYLETIDEFHVVCIFVATVLLVAITLIASLLEDHRSSDSFDFFLILILLPIALGGLTLLETGGVQLFSRRRAWPSSARWASQLTNYAAAGWIPATAIWGLGWVLVDWLAAAMVRSTRGGAATFLNYPLELYLYALVFFLGLLCFEVLVYKGVRQIRYANSTFPKPPDSPDFSDSPSAGTKIVETAQSQDRGT